MYILYNADGSVKSKKLDKYIQQGNSYSNVLFVSIADHRNFTLAGICTLPNGVKTTCTISPLETTKVIDGVTYYGKTLSITESETISAGTIRINVSATENSQVLVTFSVYLTVNETAYDSNNPVLVSWQQYNTLVTEVGNISSVEFQTTSDPAYTIAQSVKVTKNGQSTYYRFAGGGGGTSDFDYLTNRPKYNGVAMTHETDIPEVKTTTWDNKLDKTGTTQEVEESANFGIAFVNDSEEPTKYSAFRVVYGEDNQVQMAVSDNGDTAEIDITKEAVSFGVSDGENEQVLQITKDDATLTTMGENDNSIATKEYVDDADEALQTQINNLKQLGGRFLEVWNANTGAPASEPPTSPYYYERGDWYRVGTAGTKNPKGNETYVIGETNWVEGNQLNVGDIIYVSTVDRTAHTVTFSTISAPITSNILGAKPKDSSQTPFTNTDGYIIIPNTSHSTLGLSIHSGTYGWESPNGSVRPSNLNFATYSSANNNCIVGKGTLENVLDNETVRVDKEQSFDDAKKARARTNIGASAVSVSDTGTATETVQYITINGVEKKLAGGGSGGGTWGSITGTLSDQTDLKNALDLKQDIIYIDFGD